MNIQQNPCKQILVTLSEKSNTVSLILILTDFLYKQCYIPSYDCEKVQSFVMKWGEYGTMRTKQMYCKTTR